MNKNEARVRRAKKTRIRIALQRATRLVVNRTNCHIYAQIIAPTATVCSRALRRSRPDVRKDVKNGGNKAAAALVGKRIGDRREGSRHRDGRVRPLGLPLPRPRAGAGRRGSRSRLEVLTPAPRATNRERSTWRECSNGSSSRTSAATASARR
jgi:large subunit ribosomal protein L18